MGFIIGRNSEKDWHVCWKSLIEGCLCGAFMAVVGEAICRRMNWHWAAITALAVSPFIWPAIRFLWVRNSQASAPSIEQYPSSYSYGFLGAIIAVAALYLMLGAGRQTPVLLLGALVLLCFLGELIHGVLTIVIILIGGLILCTGSNSAEHDNPRCPNCSYCLIGVQAMRCPECGHGFSYEALGTTEDEFREQSKRATAE